MAYQILTIVNLALFALFPPFSEGGLGSFDFCETLTCDFSYLLPHCELAFLTHSPGGSISEPKMGGFHKSRQEAIMNQQSLFHGEHLPSRIKYQKLFEYLPELPYSYKFGRPQTNPNAILRAFIYRSLRSLSTISDLAYSLAENPSLSEAVGFDPFTPVPSIERFSAWLRSTPNQNLQEIRFNLINQLVQWKAVPGTIISLDGSAVPSPVRENNLKTSVTDRFNKNRYPRADPEARLGVYRVFIGSGTQKIRYFWGYRNHIAVDFDTELPLWEETRPANYHESRLAIPLLEACANKLKLPVQIVCADSGYDSEKILAYIIEQLHAQPVIASNKRYQPRTDFHIKGKNVICPAGLSMVYKGRMTPKKTGITYRQYCCPLHYRKKLRQRFLMCPADHPKFLSQKGCNYLVRETPSYRSQIAYGSSRFKEFYKKRTSVERVFSRLLSVAMQEPSVRGLQATQNYCTIAHISVLLVAVAAHDQGHTDKLAFVRSFVPKFMV
jgi:hypothetical protein